MTTATLTTIPPQYRAAVSAYRTLCEVAGVPANKQRYAAVVESLRSGAPSAPVVADLRQQLAESRAETAILRECVQRQALALVESSGVARSAVLVEALSRLAGVDQHGRAIQLQEQQPPVVHVHIPEQAAPLAPVVNVIVPEQPAPVVQLSPEIRVEMPATRKTVHRDQQQRIKEITEEPV